MREKILIIEDNTDTRKFLQVMLGKDYEILVAENGVTGLEVAREQQPDLIIMDVVMPVLNGFDACKLLKEDNRTQKIPVIFLSSKNTTSDITFGLSVGADDFVPKPFDYRELKTRIKARIDRGKQGPSNIIQIGQLKIDSSTRDVWFGTNKANLTLTEFDILKFLVTKKGVVVSRAEIMKEIWRDDANATSDRTIDVHIRALRKKIPAMSKHIQSIYGVGYKYEI